MAHTFIPPNIAILVRVHRCADYFVELLVSCRNKTIKPVMNKSYLKWLRQLQAESVFLDFGTGDWRFHRKHFLDGWTPSDSAFMCIPW